MGNCAPCGRHQEVNERTTVVKINQKPQLCLDKQGVSTKYLLYKSIQNQDLETTKKLYSFFSVDPNEEISVKGYSWTGLHYAAFFGSTAHMDYFLKLVYLKNNAYFADILGLQTTEKYTVLMIAAMGGKKAIVEKLLKVGGVKLNTKDAKGRTAKELAKSNGKKTCADLLEEKERTGSVVPINHDFFNNVHLETESKPKSRVLDETNEDDPKIQELLTKGRRIPCVICQENNGLIKYTGCCGQPLHSFCIEGKLKTCPYCKSSTLELTQEILYPGRALEL